MTTKEKILDMAKGLILSVGYNGFSFNDISAPLKIKNAAIHYYFPSKEALGCAVLQNEHERLKAWNDEVSSLSHWQQLEHFFEIYDTNMSHYRICMVGSVSSDFYAVPESMRELLHSLVIDIQEWLTHLLKSGRTAGTFQFKGYPEDKAAVVVTSLAAGLQIARVLSEGQFQNIKKQIRIDLTPDDNDQ